MSCSVGDAEAAGELLGVLGRTQESCTVTRRAPSSRIGGSFIGIESLTLGHKSTKRTKGTSVFGNTCALRMINVRDLWILLQLVEHLVVCETIYFERRRENDSQPKNCDAGICGAVAIGSIQETTLKLFSCSI